jgi:hypothetical protein
MTTKMVTTIYVDDNIDGTVLGPAGGWRVRFTVEGQDYHMDLKPEHYAAYEAIMNKLISYAVPVGKKRKLECAKRVGTEVADVVTIPDVEAAPADAPARPKTRLKRPRIKEFALQNGFGELHGRAPKEVEDAYDAMHGVVAA